MRFSRAMPAALAVAILGGCTNATGSSAGAASPPASSVPADAPVYPGAVERTSGSAGGSSGKVLTSTAPFRAVYVWYQRHLPPDAEKAHTTTPVQSAVFMIGDQGDQQTVTLTSVGAKTTIAIARTKM
jgi:hypothetical protein